MPAPMHIKSTLLKIDFAEANSSSSYAQSEMSVFLETTLLRLDEKNVSADSVEAYLP